MTASWGGIGPANSTSPQPRARPVPRPPAHAQKNPTSCQTPSSPRQPGCLGVDGVWQLVGFFCAWAGGLGTGRALGCGEVEFAGQIRPHDAVMRYEIDVVRYQELAASGAAVAVGDATIAVDGDVIYTIKRAKVGIFRDIDYADYPWPSRRSRGGRMER